MEKHINAQELKTIAPTLHMGEKILLSGVIYTARDQAHLRMMQALDAGELLPFAIDGAAIYYAGPTEAKPGMAIGSCGPTTSKRMDRFAPRLLDLGLSCMIGKGPRDKTVVDAMKRNGAVYLCAIGGAGALACRCIKRCDVIAYDELGCESVKRLTVEDFPLIVGIDTAGNSIFDRK